MTSPNKIGRANGDESFTFTVFGGRDRRLIPVVHMATRHANRRPRFPLDGWPEFEHFVAAPLASPAAVGEARCWTMVAIL